MTGICICSRTMCVSMRKYIMSAGWCSQAGYLGQNGLNNIMAFILTRSILVYWQSWHVSQRECTIRLFCPS
jgi:hypothetical protein